MTRRRIPLPPRYLCTEPVVFCETQSKVFAVKRFQDTWPRLLHFDPLDTSVPGHERFSADWVRSEEQSSDFPMEALGPKQRIIAVRVFCQKPLRNVAGLLGYVEQRSIGFAPVSVEVYRHFRSR